ECDLIPDNDCDPTTNPYDADRDGHDDASCGGDDCNDTVATVYEGAPEVCDGYDSDCSGEDVNLGEPAGGRNSFEDQDGDGAAPIGATCSGGFAMGDCNDGNPMIHPGAPEHCNGGIDDDCDETTSDPADCAAPTVVDAFVLATPAPGVTVDRAGL
ncbi:MAG: hypothetical protein GWO04_47975, partial [Actinobacteria bacterium]|nr:hypothetical protein [Actinomycetota bacterium]